MELEIKSLNEPPSNLSNGNSNSIDIFSHESLKKVNGKLITSIMGDNFSCYDFDPEGCLSMKITTKNKNKFRVLREAIQYKYCLPIEDCGDHFQLSPFSTYKFLVLALPHMHVTDSFRPYVDSVLEEFKNREVTLYAAGAIEKAPDHGVGYRRDLREALKFAKVKVVSPCDFEYNKEYATVQSFRDKNGSALDCYKFFRRVVEGDVEAVKNCEAMVCLIDQYIGTGTPAEATLNFAMQKPVYGLIADGFDIRGGNYWMLGCVTRFFHSYDELRQFIIYPE